jgi:inorganic triphosphatase YgiF
MPNEVELKLRINPAHIARLRRHPAVVATTIGKPLTRKLTSIYYDTPDLQLLDADVSLRVRRMSGNWFQAVKAAGNSLAGLHQRMEWEDIIAAGHPDFSKIDDPILMPIFAGDELRAALQPIFVTEVQRTEWQLTMADGSLIEMALDKGVLRVNEYTQPINEVELELKSGNAGQLFALALQLQASIPLHIENTSKAQHGYAYYRTSLPVVVKAKMTPLTKNMHAHEALRHIVWQCLAQLQGNQDMVLHGEDVEGVHQMRVALRRLRSAMRLFSAAVEPATELMAELVWISDKLGSARDIDVFLTQTLVPLLQQFDHHPGLLTLRCRAMTAQCVAYIAVRSAIRSQRYQRLLLSMGAWLENMQDDPKARSITEIAEGMLQKQYKQLQKHGKLLSEMNTEQRHQTRIAGKKLRYAAEFFVSLYSPRRTEPFLQKLADLQDVLGMLNDITITKVLAHRLAGEHSDKALHEALHILSGWNGYRATHEVPRMDAVWKVFAAQKPFWR